MVKKKKKGKVRIKQRAALKKKSEVDSVKKAPTQLPRSNGAVLKVRVRKK